jgi:hypothetical protein
MTGFLILNVILSTGILVLIVRMLAWAIKADCRPASPRTKHAAGQTAHLGALQVPAPLQPSNPSPSSAQHILGSDEAIRDSPADNCNRDQRHKQTLRPPTVQPANAAAISG